MGSVLIVWAPHRSHKSQLHAGAAFYDLEDVASDGSAVRFRVATDFWTSHHDAVAAALS
jgi:hypothetical protein